MRILVANDPRSYREVISGILEALRPRFEILEVDPEDLDEEVLRLAPDLVLCSHSTLIVRENTLTWIVLYPDYSSQAIVDLAGERATFPEMDFDTLLLTTDRAEILYQMA